MTDWQLIETAPKDGSIILGWSVVWVCPQPVCWEKPRDDPDDSHRGEPNDWVYADYALHDAVGAAGPTHWAPLPWPPEEQIERVCREHDALLAALAPHAASGWLPIETAPKDGAIRIVNDSSGGYAWIMATWGSDRTPGDDAPRAGWWEHGLWMTPQPTHWFPVPQPPMQQTERPDPG